MSTAVTMQDLELEHAELLPSRETLNVWCKSPQTSSYSYTNVVGSYNGNGDGNGLISILSGNLDGNLNGNTIVVG
jgi:hypothetical protein